MRGEYVQEELRPVNDQVFSNMSQILYFPAYVRWVLHDARDFQMLVQMRKLQKHSTASNDVMSEKPCQRLFQRSEVTIITLCS